MQIFFIRFGKTLVFQSEVGLRVFFLLFVLGLQIDILLVLVSEYNPSVIAPTPLEFVLWRAGAFSKITGIITHILTQN